MVWMAQSRRGRENQENRSTCSSRNLGYHRGQRASKTCSAGLTFALDLPPVRALCTPELYRRCAGDRGATLPGHGEPYSTVKPYFELEPLRLHFYSEIKLTILGLSGDKFPRPAIAARTHRRSQEYSLLVGESDGAILEGATGAGWSRRRCRPTPTGRGHQLVRQPKKILTLRFDRFTAMQPHQACPLQ
eukprot:SAG22_NODE_322_length_12387_cov_50.101400_6_plen_189_part_00